MALVLANRVQESATANTTVSFTLTGAVAGFQTFAVIGDTNTTYYSATDSAGNWEVGLGTYSTTGPTLTRTTIYASSNSNTAVTFSGVVSVFVTYPSGRSVNLDGSGNVSALGTVASGTWQGSTIAVAYGGTGVTTSSGASSVVLRDADQNITVNRVNQANTNTTAAAGTTILTTASSYIQTLVGTGGQTYALPDATTLTTGVAFVFNNLATGNLTITDYATATIATVASGGAGAVFLTANATVGGTWDLHAYLPEGVTFGTNAFNLGSAVVSGGTWQGGTIQPAYGGTGLTTFTGANNALYSTGSTTLTAGTLPPAAGGTGATATPTNGQLLIGNGTNFAVASLGSGTGISTTTGSGTLTINNTGVTSFSAGMTGLTPSTGTTGDVTLAGTLAIANGGTGQTTANTAFNALAPSQTSQSGRYLTTDGTNTSWAAVGGGFAAGTAMLFVQTAAPTGWTKSTTHDNKALRVVSGSASSGGTTAFTTVFTNQTPTITTSGLSAGATTLSTSQIPSHTHTMARAVDPCAGGTGVSVNFSGGTFTTNATGGGGSHTHSISGSATSSAITLNVQYVDVIIATKD